MSKYTPSTEIVRAKYRYPLETPTNDAEFNRWLDQVKADAWDEVADNLGEYAEVDDSLIRLADSIRDGNPYREQEEA